MKNVFQFGTHISTNVFHDSKYRKQSDKRFTKSLIKIAISVAKIVPNNLH